MKFVKKLLLMSIFGFSGSILPMTAPRADLLQEIAKAQKEKTPERKKELTEKAYRNLFDALAKNDGSAVSREIKYIARNTPETLNQPDQKTAENIIKAILNSKVVLQEELLKLLFQSAFDVYQSQVLLLRGSDDPLKDLPEFQKMNEIVQQLARVPKSPGAKAKEEFKKLLEKKKNAEEELIALMEEVGSSPQEIEQFKKVAEAEALEKELQSLEKFDEQLQKLIKSKPIKEDKRAAIERATIRLESALRDLDQFAQASEQAGAVEAARNRLTLRLAPLITSSKSVQVKEELEQFIDAVVLIAYFGEKYVKNDIPTDSIVYVLNKDRDPAIRALKLSSIRQVVDTFDELLEDIDDAPENYKMVIDDNQKNLIQLVRKWIALHKQIFARAIEYNVQKKKFEIEFNKRWSIVTRLLDNNIITEEDRNSALESPEKGKKLFENDRVKSAISQDQELNKLYQQWSPLGSAKPSPAPSTTTSVQGRETVLGEADRLARELEELQKERASEPRSTVSAAAAAAAATTPAEQQALDILGKLPRSSTSIDLRNKGLTRISPALMAEIAKFPNLDTLMFGNPSVSGPQNQFTTLPDFSGLTKLKTLGLMRTGLIDISINQLPKSSLKYLNLTGNPISSDRKNQIKGQLPGVRVDF